MELNLLRSDGVLSFPHSAFDSIVTTCALFQRIGAGVMDLRPLPALLTLLCAALVASGQPPTSPPPYVLFPPLPPPHLSPSPPIYFSYVCSMPPFYIPLLAPCEIVIVQAWRICRMPLTRLTLMDLGKHREIFSGTSSGNSSSWGPV